MDRAATKETSTVPVHQKTDPAEQPSSRQARRATMRAMNNKLSGAYESLRLKYGELARLSAKLQQSNQAMNLFLTWIAETVVLPKEGKAAGINHADLLKARILELVELEKRDKGVRDELQKRAQDLAHQKESSEEADQKATA